MAGRKPGNEDRVGLFVTLDGEKIRLTNADDTFILGVVSGEKLAVNMEGMIKEQERQGQRLETLEKRDGEKWRSVWGYVTTALIGGAIGFFFHYIGMM